MTKAAKPIRRMIMRSPLISRVYAEINDRRVAEGGGLVIAAIIGAVFWIVILVIFAEVVWA